MPAKGGNGGGGDGYYVANVQHGGHPNGMAPAQRRSNLRTTIERRFEEPVWQFVDPDEGLSPRSSLTVRKMVTDEAMAVFPDKRAIGGFHAVTLMLVELARPPQSFPRGWP